MFKIANSLQLKFVKTVKPLTEERQSMSCPFYGQIAQIAISCPPGPHHTVELRVLRGGDPIFPTDGGYATFDNASFASFPLSEDINRSDIITVEWINHGEFEHTISVFVSIIETKSREAKL